MKTSTLTSILLSAIASFGAAAPTLENRVQYCYNYPHRIAGSYFTKRDIEPIEPVTPAISVRSPDTDLHTRSVPLHIQWCLPGSTIYLNPVYVGQQALGIAASVVEAMVLEALEHVDQYLHTHGEG